MTRLAFDERQRAGSRVDASATIGGLNHVVRVLDFLHRTLAELEQASADFLENVEQQEAVESRASRRRDLAPAQRELFEAGGQLATAVHFRIETFYALARLLLDRVARAIEQYFGPSARLALGTHAALQDNVVAFAEQKGLQDVPAALSANARRLAAEFLADRDLHVRIADGERR